MDINYLLDQYKQIKFLRKSSLNMLRYYDKYDPTNPLGYMFSRKTCNAVDKMFKIQKQILLSTIHQFVEY